MTSLLTTIQTSTINGVTGTTLAIGNNLTSNNIDIGTSYNRTSVINIGNGSGFGSTSTDNIFIGTSLNGVNIGGIITANNGLTMGGSKNITLGDGTVAPTIGQLGYMISSTNTRSLSPIGSFNCFADNSNSGIQLTPGTWIISYNVSFYTTSTSTIWIHTFSTRLTNVVNSKISQIFNTTSGYGYQLSNASSTKNSPSASSCTCVSITANTYCNVEAELTKVGSFSGITLFIDGYLTAVRIA
jgi:hypothetical protein